ncbi:hypothetical protein TRFO_15223 [Tritrichomonas foetus]|uniref:Uncharacterized protein n=1 Tax=Tritrichomonas foetus TaxID=1144522 RepID=A0A1J4KU48_9EUKA|nr:hypothetical protein TRFO_15223 [Tritrichomonas foetus]|eukprot:OHT14432.1 hypothetical protein TRFO_15223 [Tritrichomonas foetus]
MQDVEEQFIDDNNEERQSRSFIIKTYSESSSFQNICELTYQKIIHIRGVKYTLIIFQNPVWRSELSKKTGIPTSHIKIVDKNATDPLPKLTETFYICGFYETGLTLDECDNILHQFSTKISITFNVSVINVSSSNCEESDRTAIKLFLPKLYPCLDISTSINVPCVRLYVDYFPAYQNQVITEDEIHTIFSQNIRNIVISEDNTIVDLMLYKKEDMTALIDRRFVRTEKCDISITSILTLTTLQRVSRNELKIERLPSDFDLEKAYELVKGCSNIYRVKIVNLNATMKTAIIQFTSNKDAGNFLNRPRKYNNQSLKVSRNDTRNQFPNISTPARPLADKPFVQKPNQTAPFSTIVSNPVPRPPFITSQSADENIKPRATDESGDEPVKIPKNSLIVSITTEKTSKIDYTPPPIFFALSDNKNEAQQQNSQQQTSQPKQQKTVFDFQSPLGFTPPKTLNISKDKNNSPEYGNAKYEGIMKCTTETKTENKTEIKIENKTETTLKTHNEGVTNEEGQNESENFFKKEPIEVKVMNKEENINSDKMNNEEDQESNKGIPDKSMEKEDEERFFLNEKPVEHNVDDGKKPKKESNEVQPPKTQKVEISSDNLKIQANFINKEIENDKKVKRLENIIPEIVFTEKVKKNNILKNDLENKGRIENEEKNDIYQIEDHESVGERRNNVNNTDIIYINPPNHTNTPKAERISQIHKKVDKKKDKTEKKLLEEREIIVKKDLTEKKDPIIKKDPIENKDPILKKDSIENKDPTEKREKEVPKKDKVKENQYPKRMTPVKTSVIVNTVIYSNDLLEKRNRQKKPVFITVFDNPIYKFD